MSSENDPKDEGGLNRRHFLAAGAAGLAAAGVGLPSVAAGAPMPPPGPGQKLRTNSPSGKRVAIVTDTQLNMGPYLAQEFARLAQHALASEGHRSRGVKQSPFVVLMGVQMPACLVEIGFLTNRQDAGALRTSRRRDAIADALSAHGSAARAEQAEGTEEDGTELQIVAEHCPFGDAVVEHPVICAVDRGIVKGMLNHMIGGFSDAEQAASLPQGDDVCVTHVSL